MADETIVDGGGAGVPGGRTRAEAAGRAPAASNYGATVADGGGGVGSGALPPSSGPDAIGLAGTYQVVRRIGGGGMGQVFLGRDPRTRRWVAIKRLGDAFASDPQLLARFETEAQSVAALSHFHIVALYAMADDAQGPFLAMEYVAGPVASQGEGGWGADLPAPPLDLEQFVARRGPMDVVHVRDLGVKLCSALAYAHRQGVVHRDLKPANVLLSADLEPKLTDFGLAKQQGQARDANEGHTLAGARLLTPYYGAPEQEVDGSKVDHRADLYGLAATLWYALTGESPRGFREGEVPEPLRPVLVRAMKKDREQRYADATEMMDALKAATVGGATAVAAAAGDVPPGHWRCPSCAALNADKTRFCTRCRHDGLIVCPSCQEEARPGTGFCGACGADFAALARATALKDEAAAHLAAKRYRQAVDAATAGQATTWFADDFADLRRQAQHDDQALADALASAANAERRGRLDEALAALQDASALHPAPEQLRPDRERIRQAKADAARARKEAVLNGHLATAAAKARDVDALRKAIALISTASPQHPEAARLGAEADRMEADLSTRLAEVSAANAAGDHVRARNLARQLSADYPGSIHARAEVRVCNDLIAVLQEGLRSATTALAARNYKVALAALDAVAARSPHLKDLVPLRAKAEQVRQAYHARLEQALTNPDLDAGIAALRSMAEDYPWDDRVAQQLADHQVLSQQLTGARAKLAAAEKRKDPVAMLAAWQELGRLNPEDPRAATEVAALTRRVAARRRRRALVATAAVVAAAAAATAGGIAVADHGRLVTAADRIDAKDYAGARSSLAGRTWFFRSAAADLAHRADVNERAGLIDLATADVDRGDLSGAETAFDEARVLRQSAQLETGPEAGVIAHVSALARAADPPERAGQLFDLWAKLAAGDGLATNVAEARRTFVQAMRDRAATLEQSAQFADAAALCRVAHDASDDRGDQADLATQVQQLVARGWAKADADDKRAKVGSAANDARLMGGMGDAPDQWLGAVTLDDEAANAYGKGDYAAAAAAWMAAADHYADAGRHASQVHDLRPAQTAYEIALSHCDHNLLVRFGGDSWTAAQSAAGAARAATEPSVAAEKCRQATEYLAGAERAVTAGYEASLSPTARLDEQAAQSPEAALRAGLASYNGTDGATRDWAAAMKYVRIAADAGNAEAMADVGLMCERGDGVPQSYDQARDWYRKGADRNAWAAYRLGALYYRGLGVTQDYAQAKALYATAAGWGNADAMYALGDLSYFGRGVPQDCQEAMRWYQKAADGGNTGAMRDIGVLYAGGLGVERNDVQAIAWYNKAAQAGNPSAMTFLGEMYVDGRGVAQNYDQAMSWFLKAPPDDPAAMTQIGLLCKQGLGVATDARAALSWFTKAAAADDTHGMMEAGTLYYLGVGVDRDFAQAMALWKRAADAGDGWGMRDVGILYENGQGVPKDLQQAMAWYRKAADAGDLTAVTNIGVLYDNGNGVEQDRDQAVQWYRKAAAAGNAHAKARLQELGS